jgi:hypothetical protein
MSQSQKNSQETELRMSELEIFAKSFIGQLSSDAFSKVGSLTAYLATCPEDRGGDEADVVDRLISLPLLRSLGYKDTEVTYNHAKGDLTRPDYDVAIQEYPGRSCFIIEDKNTTETKLATHRPQLDSHLTSKRAPRGLLINGHSILGYDNLGNSTTPTISMSLAEIVSMWRGEHVLVGHKSGFEALQEPQRASLAVLLKRYGRASYADLSNQIDDLTIQHGSGKPHEPNGGTWVAGKTRIPLSNAQVVPEQLTNAIKDLISDLETDVSVQCRAHEARLEEYHAQAARLPSGQALYSDRVKELVNRLSYACEQDGKPRKD